MTNTEIINAFENYAATESNLSTLVDKINMQEVIGFWQKPDSATMAYVGHVNINHYRHSMEGVYVALFDMEGRVLSAPSMPREEIEIVA